MELSETTFILKKDETKNIDLKLIGFNKPDNYYGYILIKSADLSKNLPVTLEIVNKTALFDIKVILREDSREVPPGSDVEADIMLYNFGTKRPVDVLLNCTIESMENEVYDYMTETLAVETQVTIMRKMSLPYDVEEGYYLYMCRLYYEGISVSSSDLITVKSVVHVERPWTISNLLWILIGIILFLIFLIWILLFKKRKKKHNLKEKKQRRLSQAMECPV